MYLKAYQTIRKNAEAARAKRKRDRALALVLDPAAAIKRKQKRNEHSRVMRQRKYLKYKPHKQLERDD